MSMSILDELISTLDTEAEVKDVRLGLFYTGVWTRNCGLAATLPRDVLRREPPAVHRPGRLISKGASELVGMAYSERLLEAAVGMAAVNSLLEINEEPCLELNAASLIAEKGKNKRVAMVGHFPFVPRLREAAAELWVIEKNPHQGDSAEAGAKNLIPRAQVVGITGSAFTNQTADELLKLCNPEAYVVVLGGTAPMSRVLFDYGVDAICGTKVTDPELALCCLSQGANYRQIEGVRQLTMVKE
jgi:uncharacterized protein (DUF4213/DUF364 family)